MINNLKLSLMKVFTVILIMTLALELKIISLKNQKELETQEKIEKITEEKTNKKKNNILNFLSLDDTFNISKLENYGINSWNGYINFSDSLEEGIKKVHLLEKKDFTIENYNVEYKDGYGNFNLKVRAGD